MTNPAGIILYGPPASGKSTLTRTLQQISTSYRLYQKLKVGGSKSVEYQSIDAPDLDRLRKRGELVYENEQYGASYAIEKTGLDMLLRGHSPLVHLGQERGVNKLTTEYEGVFLVVALECSLPTTVHRLHQRPDHDLQRRTHVWHQTSRLLDAHLVIDTEVHSIEVAASMIQEHFSSWTQAPAPRQPGL